MNCRKALRLLYDVIDKEASKIDTQEVEHHLKNCRHCMAKYEMEKMFQTLVVEKGRTTSETDVIKNKILAKLDAIDAAGEVGAPQRPFKWTAVAIASAAALVLCVLASFWVGDYYRYQTELAPFITTHFHSINGDHEAMATDPFDYLYAQIGLRINPPAEWPVDAIRSVSIDTIKGVQFGHIEMAGTANSIISIFVTTPDKYHPPSKPAAMVDGRKLMVHQCDQCCMVGGNSTDLVYIVISEPDHSPDELAQLASVL